MITHDWPKDIERHGDFQELLRARPYWRESIEGAGLGSPASLELLHELKPRHWVAGHMHYKYSAVYEHTDRTFTRFLALDKAADGSDSSTFLGILDFPEAQTGPLRYDEEWLAILRATHDSHFFGQAARIPKSLVNAETVNAHRRIIAKMFAESNLDYAIDPSWFEISVPTHPFPKTLSKKDIRLPKEFTENSQSVKFINLIGLPFSSVPPTPPSTTTTTTTTTRFDSSSSKSTPRSESESKSKSTDRSKSESATISDRSDSSSSAKYVSSRSLKGGLVANDSDFPELS